MYDIALVVSDLTAGGAQRVLVTLANAWRARGRLVLVVTLSKPEHDFFRLADGIDRIALDVAGDRSSLAGAVWSNLSRAMKIRRAIRKSGAPVVLSFVGSTNVLTVLATVGLDVMTVISERNDPARQSLGRVWDTLRTWIYPSADLVTANSRGAIDTLAKFIPKEKLRHVPNPIKLTKESGRPRASENPTILTVGRLTPQKAQHLLLQAFSQFVGHHPDGELEHDLKRRADELGIGHAVEFVGRVNDPNIHYASAEIFVLSSLFEGTPNALLEAMSHRLPSIISDACGGGLEFVEHGVSGRVFKSGDATDLAASITMLANDPSLRRRLGAAGFERVSRNGEEAVLDHWDDVLGLSKA